MGVISVTLPTILSLFAPIVFTIVWIMREGRFLIWPLFVAMLLGVIFSYFVYRQCSRRWLNWALGQASDLGRLKRKAIQNSLISEKGTAVFSTESMLEPDMAQKLRDIDHEIAQQDDASVPAEVLFQEVSNNRQTAYIAFGLFGLAALIILLVTPQRQWMQLINFTPILLVGIYFLFKKEKTKFLARINEKGIQLPESSWTWESIRSTKYSVKHHGASSSGRPGSSRHSYTSRNLTVIFQTGQQEILSLGKASKSVDLAEYIAVYRYRHAQNQLR